MLPSLLIGARQRFHSDFIWRSTGFALETLEEFAMDEFAEELRRLTSGPPLQPRAYAGDVPAGFAARFEQRFATLRKRLHAVAGSVRVQMAVASSSPTAAEQLRFPAEAARARRTSAIRRRERLGMRYLQRLTTKCETSAFFGPIATGRFCRTDTLVDLEHHPGGYRGAGYVGERFLGGILRQLRQDPGVLSGLSVRRRSGVAFAASDIVVHPRFGALRLDLRAVRALAEAAQPVRVEDLLRHWRGERQTGLVALFALVELGLMSDDLEAAWHATDPVVALRSHVARSAERSALTTLLDLLDEALATWPRADALAKGKTLAALNLAGHACGVAPVEGGARFYGGHLPVFEDGFAADNRLCIDEAWADPFLHDLAGVIRASVAADAACAGATRRRVARQMARAGVRRIGLADFLQRFPGAGEGVQNGNDGAASARSQAVITSPDVLIAAHDLEGVRRGDCEWILSECHSSVAAASFFIRPMPGAAGWLDGIDRFLASRFTRSALIALTGARDNKTAFTGVLRSARYLETGLSAHPDANTIQSSELDVVAEDDLRLVLRDTGRPLTLLPGHPPGTAPGLDCFRTPRYAPLQSESASNARARHGRVVYRRARWTVEADALPPPGSDVLEVFCWGQFTRQAYGLPRWIFVRAPSERKPLCIDLSNPFLCEELHALLRRDGALSVEEMHPAPTDAWVRGADGRYLGELRLLYADEGAAA
ncbi:MAG: hypothetical protein EPO51_19915 [Phenylobacterium sp.]|uniref:lantibiotic dehydratase n=1 Tax=Phenylobacterium sp. TaxID=1871053 RepID=UPI0011FE445D|nr:lantibiotic dehydratase [Phenylobacterium sp.]TAJ69798.1 MAG: hypothetical protein EPO51_19915 [Phenylobacterium sp.]